MRYFLFLIIAFGFCLSAEPSFASRAYVTDTFEVVLRTGPSPEHRVIAVPLSGQPVEVLESDGNWSRVRLPGDSAKEGWMLSRYLITRLPWEMQANALREENTALREKVAGYEKRVNAALKDKQEMGSDLQTSTERLRELQKDYDSLKRGAEGYLKLKAVHEATKSSLKATREELRRLASENEQLRSSQINRWFATGALILLCGLLIGLITGRQEKRRRAFYK